MGVGQGLVLLSVALQSLGKVLYGTLLTGVSVPLFVVVSFCLTAAAFLAIARFHLPHAGRAHLLRLNVWTAVSFISFFFALKHLPPAVLASIEIGLSLITAVAVVSIQDRARPQALRVLVCVGIVAGCALLSWAEIADSMSGESPLWDIAAVAASAVVGVASAFCAIESKKLAALNWAPAEVLAHRFYLTILIAALWFPLAEPRLALPDAGTLTLIALIGAVGILTPLLFLQIALRKTDALSAMVCLAAQPILSFLIAMPSPAYEWDAVTLLGVIIVTAFVALDIVAQRHTAAAAPPPSQPRRVDR